MPMDKFVNQYKIVLGTEQAAKVVVSLALFTHLKNLSTENVILMKRIPINIKMCYKIKMPKIWLCCWLLSLLLSEHECAYTCVLPSFVRK